MKTEILLISLLALAGTALFFIEGEQATLESPASDVFQRYVSWKAKFNKNTNSSEDKYRFVIFQENLALIEEHNATGSKTVLGLTEFADLTNEEFRSAKISQITESSIRGTKKSTARLSASDPDALNWVEKGVVAPIQDQGNCGSCWAFSAVTSLESLNAINSGDLEKFSEQQLVSCIPFPYSLGCMGGNPIFGFAYTALNGISTEEAYPYVQQTNPKTASCDESQIDSVFQNESIGIIEENSPSDMQAQLVIQPLSIAVAAGNIYFQLYTSGVIDSPNCGTDLDHAIGLVGYDFSGDNNYWIVRNSWGASWGEGGYANIENVDGPGICGINMNVTYPTEVSN